MTTNKFYPDLIAYPLVRNPDKTALTMDERSFTYRELDQRVRKLASLMKLKGCKAGDRVALVAYNEIEFFELQIACIRLGLALVPINWRLSSPEMRGILRDATPSVIIHSESFADTVRDFDSHLLELGADYEDALEQIDACTEEAWDIAGSAAFAIMYTSGTTGTPKGVMLTNRAMRSRLSICAFEQAITNDDCFLMAMPLFHVGSITALSYLYAGGEIVITREFSPEHFIDITNEHQINICMLVPTMINAIINHPKASKESLSVVDLIIYGGSPIQASLLSEAQKKFSCKFLQNYGMTETGPITCLRPDDHQAMGTQVNLLESAGTSVMGCEIRVVDAESKDVPRGCLGEVVCRGEVVMDRYLNNDQETQAALIDGWMHTGDIGYLNEENYLYITDRKKDLIISGGENVSPREVEVVLDRLDEVQESAVIGVPDDYWGERVHGVVVLKPGVSLDKSNIQTFCRDHLASYKVPKSIEFTSELPRTLSGKVEKNTLRNQWWQGEKRQVH